MKEQPVLIRNREDIVNLIQAEEFKPVELRGHFDEKIEILVNRTKHSVPGHLLISPFYCYQDEDGKMEPILVDKGFVDSDWDQAKKKIKIYSGQTVVRGIVFKGDLKNKYSQPNEPSKNKWNTVSPDEIAEHLDLPNKEIVSQFLIKEVDFEEKKKNIMPVSVSMDELMTWTIMPPTHQSYANFWMITTILNIASNLYVWIAL